MKFSWYWAESRQRSWKITRTKGKVKFMLYQALPWAVMMFIIAGLFPVILEYSAGARIEFVDVLLPVIIWTIGGWFYGLLSWSIAERLYHKHLS